MCSPQNTMRTTSRAAIKPTSETPHAMPKTQRENGSCSPTGVSWTTKVSAMSAAQIIDVRKNTARISSAKLGPL